MNGVILQVLLAAMNPSAVGLCFVMHDLNERHTRSYVDASTQACPQTDESSTSPLCDESSGDESFEVLSDGASPDDFLH